MSVVVDQVFTVTVEELHITVVTAFQWKGPVELNCTPGNRNIGVVTGVQETNILAVCCPRETLRYAKIAVILRNHLL